MLDVVGLGALNYDYIATRTRLLTLEPATRSEVADRFEHGTERPVSPDEIERTLSQMGHQAFEVCLGGSAFNTIQALAELHQNIRLGFIGVVGKRRSGAPSFAEYMDRARIDKTLLFQESNQPSGVCISYLHNGERSLETCAGANQLLATHLSNSWDAAREYISRAGLVHVTSLFDNHTPQLLVQLLTEAKKDNPWMRISFDPGHHWVKHQAQSISAILNLADYVFLNSREFEILGHHRPGTSDIDVAKNIFGLCTNARMIILVKRYDAIIVFSSAFGKVIEIRHDNIVLPPDEIEDATGAGDVFAAGFIAGLLLPGFETSHSIELGLRLVRHKLRYAGSAGFSAFASLLHEFITDLQPPTSTILHSQFPSEQTERLSVHVDLGGVGIVLSHSGTHSCSLTLEETRFFNAIAEGLTDEGIPSIIRWSTLNSIVAAADEDKDVEIAANATRRAVTAINRRLNSQLGPPPSGTRWILTKRGAGAFLTPHVSWKFSKRLEKLIRHPSLPTGRIRTVDPLTMGRNTRDSGRTDQ